MPNRLAQSQSLYLRKHAENPIDWWPWSDEALARAKADKKPIFLSIGYSSCHWCTVMEGEAFSDPTIAEYMNANFFPIKVDREERPDIDSIYMQALQMLTGQGGWPLNVFLSSDDLVPFYGGTYFPREPRYGRPGFLQLLQALRRYHDTEPGKVRSLKEEILGYLQQAAILSTDDGTQELSQDLLRQGWETNTAVISGGNYSNPSFPMIPYAQLALRGNRFKFESKYDSEQACTQRAFDLTLGGIYDHVAGGFHRYTVDSTWTVPHFEKMLYDNGQIVEYLASLWSAGVHEPAFERAIAGTVTWLNREMTAPEGYFWAAQDADSFTPPHQGVWSAEPEEGAFYVWSYDELARLLTAEELGELQQQFTVTVEGNFEGNNVLQRRHLGSLSETIENALLKLFEFRYGATASTLETFPPARNNQEVKAGNWPGRIPPVTDTKMIVAWNSLTISGLARAGAVFRNPEYLSVAVKAARFILDNQFVDGRFYRINYDGKPSVLAQSEDYALFVKALLDLHQASLGLGTGNERHRDKGTGGQGDILTELFASASQFPMPNFWLEKALQVQEEFDDYLWSVELSGYYNTASDASGDLLVRERSYADNATPAANGVAIANLVQLAILTENLQFLDRAEQALRAFSGVMQPSPQACPSLFAALDWYLHCTLVRTTDSQIASLINQYLPTAIFSLETMPSGIVGLVCQGLSCLEPATSFEQMLEQVDRSQVRS